MEIMKILKILPKKNIGIKIALDFGILQLSLVQDDQKLHFSLGNKVNFFVCDFGTK